MSKKAIMDSKFIFVTDYPCDETLYHASAFDKADCVFMGITSRMGDREWRLRKLPPHMAYLKTAYKTVRKSTERDVIITPDFNIGAYTLVLSKLAFRKRTVVSLDVMLHHESNRIPVKVRRFVYGWVLKNPNFHISVPRKEILKPYKSLYKIDEQRVFESCGCYDGCQTQDFSQGDRSVLCAGKRRDWITFIKTARLLPKVRFIGVADRKTFDSGLLKRLPRNLEMLYDLPDSELREYLSRCAVVCIPVENDWVDKKILFQAAFMHKPIVCTKTPALTSIVVNEEREGALLAKKGDCQTMAVHIDDLLNIPWKAEDLTKKMFGMAEAFSPHNFSKSLLNYVCALKKSGREREKDKKVYA